MMTEVTIISKFPRGKDSLIASVALGHRVQNSVASSSPKLPINDHIYVENLFIFGVVSVGTPQGCCKCSFLHSHSLTSLLCPQLYFHSLIHSLSYPFSLITHTLFFSFVVLINFYSLSKALHFTHPLVFSFVHSRTHSLTYSYFLSHSQPRKTLSSPLIFNLLS